MDRFWSLPTDTLVGPLYGLCKNRAERSGVTWLLASVSRYHDGSERSGVDATYAKLLFIEIDVFGPW